MENIFPHFSNSEALEQWVIFPFAIRTLWYSIWETAPHSARHGESLQRPGRDL